MNLKMQNEWITIVVNMSRAEPVTDPRIAKKEMIITRFKSAQQKKQLYKDKEQKQTHTKTKVTQAISIQPKSPNKLSKSPQNGQKIQATAPKSTVSKSKPSKKGKTQKSPMKRQGDTQDVTPIVIEDDKDDEHPEYYPEKLKRATGARKVFLKPKQKSTMIARTNKRKFNTPKRGIKSPVQNTSRFPSNSSVSNCPSPVSSELSMSEVIRIVEENDSLDDEDLMEILTCPSPVWWEEPPDEMFIEEAIGTRKPEENVGKTKSPIRERCLNTLRNSVKQNSNTKTSFNGINNERKEITDDKFIKKSKKLEHVLGNIKNKVTNCTILISKSIKHEKLDNAKSLQECDGKSSDITNLKDNPDLIIDKCDDNDDLVTDTSEDVNVNNNNAKSSDVTEHNAGKNRKIKHVSESTDDSFVDLNGRDQELWLDLENINIPIENTSDMNSPDCVIINEDQANNVIDVDALGKKFDDKNSNNPHANEIDAKDSNTKSEINADDNVSKSTNPDIKDLDEVKTQVPKNMPPLVKCPKFENVFTSPSSYKSISDDITESSSLSGVDIIDTISDTNIKFITDDDIDDSDGDIKNTKSNVQKDESNENSTVKDGENLTEWNDLAVLTNINETKSKDAYITVYKIVPNDDTTKKPRNKFKNIPEYSNYVKNLIQTETKTDAVDESLENDIPDVPIDNKGQLNSFFKKCKNANRKRKRLDHDKIDAEIDENKSPKKSITVAQEENVKYCLKCSAIFDTEDCSYCLKTKQPKESLPGATFTCDKCDFVGETSNNVNTHLEEHNVEEEAKT